MISHRHCVNDVVACIRSNHLRDITLVGHSASAPLAMEAAIALGPTVVERVVLSSPMLPPFPGMSVLDTLPMSLRKFLVENSMQQGNGNRFAPALTFELFQEFFANAVSPEFAHWFFTHYLCPQPSLRLVASPDLRRFAETNIDISILEVTDDPLCTENNQVMTAREALVALDVRLDRLGVTSMSGGGLAFISRPHEFAAALVDSTKHAAEAAPLDDQAAQPAPMHHE
jgi:pimeloyl-ACP methyl ester carboxylesterase